MCGCGVCWWNAVVVVVLCHCHSRGGVVGASGMVGGTDTASSSGC